MMAAAVPVAMSVRRNKAEQIFSGLEAEFNSHLPKVLGFVASEELCGHWNKELRTWATKLSIITLKDDYRPVRAKDVFDRLYDETSGGRDLQNNEALLTLVSEDYQHNATPADEISARLKTLHQAFVLRISKHEPGYDLINGL